MCTIALHVHGGTHCDMHGRTRSYVARLFLNTVVTSPLVSLTSHTCCDEQPTSSHASGHLQPCEHRDRKCSSPSSPAINSTSTAAATAASSDVTSWHPFPPSRYLFVQLSLWQYGSRMTAQERSLPPPLGVTWLPPLSDGESNEELFNRSLKPVSAELAMLTTPMDARYRADCWQSSELPSNFVTGVRPPSPRSNVGGGTRPISALWSSPDTRSAP